MSGFGRMRNEVRMRTRIMSRAAAVVVVPAIALCITALPASAHVEVSADKPQAGATNVTLTFVGQAESDSAGIRSERIVLPAGIEPADVTLAAAPPGWRLLPTRDGVTVGGKVLPVGRDAIVSIRVARLPAGRTRLPFKTIETYGDGTINRWIEVRKGTDEPRNPAPMLRLRAASVTEAMTTAAPTAAAPAATAPGSTPSESVAAPGPASRASAGASTGAAILWLAVGALIVLLGAGALRLRRRRSS